MSNQRRTRVYFGGVELTEYCYVSDLRTSLLPRRIGLAEVPGMDGSLFTGAQCDARVITLTLTLVDSDLTARQEATRLLSTILLVDEPEPLQFSFDGGKYYMAIPQSNDDATRFLTATSFEVEFVCPDPVMYGNYVERVVPSGGTLDWAVLGSYPVMPLITVPDAANGPDGFWRLALDDGTYVIATIPDAVQTAEVVVDCKNRTLKVNGDYVMLQPEADWLVLHPTIHTLTMTGSGTCTVSYEERWV